MRICELHNYIPVSIEQRCTEMYLVYVLKCNSAGTFAEVGVDAHVPRCAGQALVFPVWDVFVGL